jgi:Sulfatase
MKLQLTSTPLVSLRKPAGCNLRRNSLLKDDLKIADDTIVLYTTDNGPHMNTWPDGAMTPFRSEKNTNWEGAFRVPCMIRWPGKIKAGSISNEMVSGLDWCSTLLAAAGDPDVNEKLLKGHEADGKRFNVHLDGFNQLPYLTGQQERSAPALLLLQRRRGSGRPAIRKLQGSIPGAAGTRHLARVGRAEKVMIDQLTTATRTQLDFSLAGALRAGEYVPGTAGVPSGPTRMGPGLTPGC